MNFLFRTGYAPMGMCYDPVTFLVVAATAYGGYSSYKAGQEQRSEYEEQAQIQREETERAAKQKETERRQFLASQRMAYLANGVTLTGTPLTVGENTWADYQEEIDAIRRSGYAQAGVLDKQGQRAYENGRTQLITSLIGSGAYGYKNTAKPNAATTKTTSSNNIFN